MDTATKAFVISIGLVASLLLSSITLTAQGTVSSDWSALKTISAGSKLSLKLKNGKAIDGKLNSVSDSSLSLSVKNAPVEFKREDILSIYQITKRSATKPTLIGMAGGAGIGAVVGAVGGSNDDSFDKIDHAVTAGLTVLGAGAGALTGYLIGRGSSKRVLVYEAK